ncbi:hypothetical protein [Flavobacterium turcicum]|uniref:Peptidase M56 domain-containing protein n=1 Tax=Flavobacterium turcicum TaxID=2764718 RepID=A0ABR7JDH9_9FLAO|nr:hypothetical protein [Flavobacterium turcicum]MBC5862559.1 hypothetical protein [Flavobacterium turcicum]NHL01290.1 hypothetical protein [Flavobacterium turcicum]
MFLIVAKYLIPKGYRSITLFPFIIFNDKCEKQDLVLVQHEKIHLRQQLELLIIPFFLWYAIEFCWHLIKLKKWQLAYRAISFEREAYANEHDLSYFTKRPIFNFFRFLS